ncbi:MAG: DUF2304 domain-containing protein [Deltaproteobacteria bacterium]|nr:MAG: DUF2304 domain-containing protein [Deltaproteobacteria bacterium]
MEIAIHLRILIGFLCFSLVGIIIELIRQNRLKEHYAIIWLFTAMSIFVFGIWPNSLNLISRIVRLHHLTTLFLLSFIFLLAIVLHFTLVMSQLFDRNRRLTQEVAWLRFEMEQLRQPEEDQG